MACLDAASMWGGSVGGRGELRHRALGPHCTLHTDPSDTVLLTNTMQNPNKDSNTSPNKGKLIFIMFLHRSRKC